MKKLMFAFVFALLVGFVMADSDSHGRGSNNVEDWTGSTKQYTYSNGIFQIDVPGDFTIQLYQPASKNGQIITDFGYYFIGNNEAIKSEMVSLIKDQTGSGKAILKGNEVFKIENLTKDSKLGLYYMTNETTVFSEATKNSGGSDLFFPLHNTKDNTYYFTFGSDDASWGDGGILGFQTGVTEFNNNIEIEGQPLPGVLTTCAIAGGAAAAAARIRKKKKEQK